MVPILSFRIQSHFPSKQLAKLLVHRVGPVRNSRGLACHPWHHLLHLPGVCQAVLSHWLPEEHQLPGLWVHILLPESLDSWVIRPTAMCTPLTAWVAPHQLWGMQAAPWQIPVCS